MLIENLISVNGHLGVVDLQIPGTVKVGIATPPPPATCYTATEIRRSLQGGTYSTRQQVGLDTQQLLQGDSDWIQVPGAE
jgi:hypothetical protein